jgi:nucleoredoxin
MSAYSIFGQLHKTVPDKVPHTVLDDVPIVALYFSAKWCGPCKLFTPKLIELYNEANKDGKKLEIIFVTADNDEEEFEAYYGTMPWLAVEFDDILDEVQAKYPASSIPKLTVLNKDGSVKIEDAKAAVEDKGIAALADWE